MLAPLAINFSLSLFSRPNKFEKVFGVAITITPANIPFFFNLAVNLCVAQMGILPSHSCRSINCLISAQVGLSSLGTYSNSKSETFSREIF